MPKSKRREYARAGRVKRRDAIREERGIICLIVCEGEKTEPNYFRGLVDFLNENGSNKIKVRAVGKGRNTTDLVENLEEYFIFSDKLLGQTDIPYGKIIVVFDKDSFGDVQFNEAIEMARRKHPECIVAWSNESFELWLYLHYHYSESVLGRHEYNKKLSEILKDKNFKTEEMLFNKIIENGGSVKKAIHNAKKLLKSTEKEKSPAKKNPATMVFEAVEALCNEAGYKFK